MIKLFLSLQILILVSGLNVQGHRFNHFTTYTSKSHYKVNYLANDTAKIKLPNSSINKNDIIVNVIPPGNKDETSNWFNLINVVIGILGLLIAMGLGVGGKNFIDIKRLIQDFKARYAELDLYYKETRIKFDELEKNYRNTLNNLGLMNDQFQNLTTILKKSKNFNKDENYSKFYRNSILSKISDTQPTNVVTSSLRMVANMGISEAIPYIDSLLKSSKIDDELRSVAINVKNKLLTK